jgi:glucose-6-phosphate 1-dehydrogenase
MEPPPGNQDTERLRDEKVKVLKSISPLDPGRVVRGQFRGYRTEAGVSPDSTMETFAAVRLEVNSWRWQGVPFFIRAGKHMPITVTEVVAKLRRPPPIVQGVDLTSNHVRFRLSPEFIIALGATVRESGHKAAFRDVELVATHEQDGTESDPYEELLGDAIMGETFRFARQDYVEEAWRIVDPALLGDPPVREYERGSWGPKEAEALVPGGWFQ